MKMTNDRNRSIYRAWAPVYDAVLGRFFLPGRKRAIQALDIKPGEKVLLVGVGTGADLPLLTTGAIATGIDLSPEMLQQARDRLPLSGGGVTLIEGDAQQLQVEPASFDVVIFSLILSVIPDPASCLRENLRALKPGGRAVVFDKFQPDGGNPSIIRRFFNIFSTAFGTDVTRRFGEIAKDLDIKVLSNEPSIFHGTYRVILLIPS
jgi:ubiquinone/menaquinone biosynthesis C-methylase UbiE